MTNKNFQTNKLPKALSIIFLYFLLLTGIYHSIFTRAYFFHDDVNFFLMTPLRPYHLSHNLALALGRWLGSYLVNFYGNIIVHTITDLNILRIISIFQISIGAFILYTLFKNIKMKSLSSFIIPLILLTLPPYQVMISYIGMSFQITAFLLALIAAYLTISLSTSSTKPYLKKSVLLLLPVLLLFCALITHQTAAMFFWVPLGIYILFKDDKTLKEIKDLTINFFSVGFASLTLFFILLRIQKSHFIQFTNGIYNPYSMTNHWLDKMLWFVKEPVLSSFNFWNIFPSQTIALSIILFISCIALLRIIYLLYNNKTTNQKRSIFIISSILFLCVIIPILSFLPNLAANGKAPSYRCYIGLMSFFLLCLIWAIKTALSILSPRKKNVLLNALLITLCLFGSFITNKTILQYRVFPSHAEYTFVKNRIESSDLNQYKRIHCIQPPINIKQRYDEYGTLTSSFAHDWVGLVSIIIRDITKKNLKIYFIDFNPQTKLAKFIFYAPQNPKKKIPYIIKLSTSHIKLNADNFKEKTLIVDMNKLFTGHNAPLRYLIKS